MADNKLEIEIIDDGDGGATSLSPDDFSSIREFNKALARLKAETRAQEFEASQELKARRANLKNQKATLDEEKQARKTGVEQIRMEVQERKARRQLDVVVQQEERAREAEINKRDRHREMMLRHILGAVNPNSTFQYRMSSIYGLLNTAGVTSSRESSGEENENGERGVYDRVHDIMEAAASGIKSLFGQTTTFFASLFGKAALSSVVSPTSSPNVPPIDPASTQELVMPGETETDMPWWWSYRPQKFRPKWYIESMRPSGALNAGSQMMGMAIPPVPVNPYPTAAGGAGGGGAIPPIAAGGGGGTIPPIAAGASPGGQGGGGGSGKFLAAGIALRGMSALGLGIAGFAAGALVATTALTALYGATNLLSRRFVGVADEIGQWSIAMTMAKTETTLRTMAFNMERANRFGEQFAEFEKAKTTANIGMAKLYDSITMPFMPLVTGSYNLLGKIADGLSELIDMAFTFTGGRFVLDLLGEFAGNTIPGIWEGLNNPDGTRGAGAFIKLLQDIFRVLNRNLGIGNGPSQGELTASSQLAAFLNMPISNQIDRVRVSGFQGFAGDIGL
jgi:hypothetical protein